MSKSFYDQTADLVKDLINTNKRLLIVEINQSKELAKLLGQSTLRDLTDEELDQVKGQLLDVFKAIPSLAIFMLPGGAILLPIVIKYIPQLLPSAFKEEYFDEEDEDKKE